MIYKGEFAAAQGLPKMLLVSYPASYAGKLLLRTCVTALFIRISQMTLETLPNVVLDAVVERAGFGHGWRLEIASPSLRTSPSDRDESARHKLRGEEAYFFFLRAAGFLEGALRFFFAKSCDTSTSSSSSSET